MFVARIHERFTVEIIKRLKTAAKLTPQLPLRAKIIARILSRSLRTVLHFRLNV
jgi:hypothetical protein